MSNKDKVIFSLGYQSEKKQNKKDQLFLFKPILFALKAHSVTYWPSTELTIKRCTCVNKWKQVYVKQKYNQDTDGLSQLEIGCQRSENQLQTDGLGPSVAHGWAAQPESERSAAMVRRTWGQYVAVCPRLQLTSHTQETSPFQE